MYETKKEMKLFVAMPTYGGQMYTSTVSSLINLQKFFFEKNLHLEFLFVSNESLIQRARNTLVHFFLNKTDCTHLLFIDSDIHFHHEDVLSMIKADVDVIGGLYPIKHIHWQQLKEAIQSNPSLDSSEYPKIASKIVFNYCNLSGDNKARLVLDQPMEITEIGTGFMLIKRHVFEHFQESYPNKKYKTDDGLGNETASFFNVEIDPSTQRLLSEDYNFCKDVRAIGHKIYAAPWVELAHNGTHKFECSLEAVAKYIGKIS